MAGRILVYGGKGALGASVVSHFKSKNWWVASIDMNSNEQADLNILVNKEETLEQQQAKVGNEISSALQEMGENRQVPLAQSLNFSGKSDGAFQRTVKRNKLDAIICVAGGWAGGNAKKDLVKNSELMWRQSIWSSLISAEVAAHHLRDGGLLSLTGAKAALEGTPGMIGYGMAKAAVHHLVKSLAGENSGMPKDSTALAILPITLDTPMNRKWMPKADFSTWTSLDYLSNLFMDWTLGKERPANGSLITLVTNNFETKAIPV